MQKVSVEGIILDLLTNAPVLILKNEKGKVLPISIGIFEAYAILAVFEKTSIQKRPLTHDLIKKLINSLSAEFLRLEIHSLKNGVYYANLIISTGNKQQKIDCRPSDGIAVALRFQGDIFVADNLLEETLSVTYGKGTKFFKTARSDAPISEAEAENMRKTLDGMSAEEFWKEIMEK